MTKLEETFKAAEETVNKSPILKKVGAGGILGTMGLGLLTMFYDAASEIRTDLKDHEKRIIVQEQITPQVKDTLQEIKTEIIELRKEIRSFNRRR